MKLLRLGLLGLLGCLLWTTASSPALAQADAEPETVLVSYHVQADKQSEMEALIRKQWAALRRLDVVEEQPHVLLRGTEDGGKPVFVEVFTWRTADAADHLPAEIQTLWSAMNKAVESRGGHAGIDIRAMTPMQ